MKFLNMSYLLLLTVLIGFVSTKPQYDISENATEIYNPLTDQKNNPLMDIPKSTDLKSVELIANNTSLGSHENINADDNSLPEDVDPAAYITNVFQNLQDTLKGFFKKTAYNKSTTTTTNDPLSDDNITTILESTENIPKQPNDIDLNSKEELVQSTFHNSTNENISIVTEDMSEDSLSGTSSDDIIQTNSINEPILSKQEKMIVDEHIKPTANSLDIPLTESDKEAKAHIDSPHIPLTESDKEAKAHIDSPHIPLEESDNKTTAINDSPDIPLTESDKEARVFTDSPPKIHPLGELIPDLKLEQNDTVATTPVNSINQENESYGAQTTSGNILKANNQLGSTDDQSELDMSSHPSYYPGNADEANNSNKEEEQPTEFTYDDVSFMPYNEPGKLAVIIIIPLAFCVVSIMTVSFGVNSMRSKSKKRTYRGKKYDFLEPEDTLQV